MQICSIYSPRSVVFQALPYRAWLDDSKPMSRETHDPDRTHGGTDPSKPDSRATRTPESPWRPHWSHLCTSLAAIAAAKGKPESELGSVAWAVRFSFHLSLRLCHSRRDPARSNSRGVSLARRFGPTSGSGSFKSGSLRSCRGGAGRSCGAVAPGGLQRRFVVGLAALPGVCRGLSKFERGQIAASCS